MPAPLISLITATWNSEATIVPCIESVNEQDWENIEHVFVDGGSMDSTLKLIANHSTRTHRCISERDDGIYDALNKGIALACGDIIGFVHSDDMLAASGVLSLIAREFDDPTVDAVYGNLDYVGRVDRSVVIRRWRSQSFRPELLRKGWMPAHPTLYVRASVLRELGPFDLSYKISADYAHVLRLFGRRNLKAIHLDTVIVKMSVGGISNRSFSSILRKSREDFRALREAEIGGFWTLLQKNLRKVSQFF